MSKTDESRRDILKKGVAFALPTIATFQMSELSVYASNGHTGRGNIKDHSFDNDNDKDKDKDKSRGRGRGHGRN
ncbi:MAG: hypothetical protein ACYC9O_14370 [Candidatus Latescibacterota bacterium]